MPTEIKDTVITKAKKEAAEKKRRIELIDQGHQGLHLRVYPKGRAVWALVMRTPHGRMGRYTVGEYPLLGLSKARDKARALRADIEAGANPVADARRKRKAGKDARAGVGTLLALIDQYERIWVPVKPMRSWPKARPRVLNVFKPLLHRPLISLKPIELQHTANDYESRGEAFFAIRSLRPVIKWGVKNGYVENKLLASEMSNPQTNKRKRTLSEAELGRVLLVLKPETDMNHAALRWILWTLCRLDEACGATWQEIDLVREVWTLSPDRTKNETEHYLRLPKQAVAMIKAIRPANPDPKALVFPSRAGTVLSNWDRKTKAIQADSGTADWQRHDLRRTGATMLGKMEVQPAIVEAALNHKTIFSALKEIYNSARYAVSVGESLQTLADAQDRVMLAERKTQDEAQPEAPAA